MQCTGTTPQPQGEPDAGADSAVCQQVSLPACGVLACRSHLAPVRATAAAALLQFLLDYPLSPSRLQGHMVFLLTNTSYEHEEGRLQALEMLQQVGYQSSFIIAKMGGLSCSCLAACLLSEDAYLCAGAQWCVFATVPPWV